MNEQLPTERFSSRVADYVRYRPGYPEALIREIFVRTGLLKKTAVSPTEEPATAKPFTEVCTVADIGAGTGIFTRMLSPYAGRIWAVEPNQDMRQALEDGIPGSSKSGRVSISVIHGTAEATGLPDASVDLVTCAQAFHWFDLDRTKNEFIRILRNEKWVALVWNERHLTGTPFLEGYEALLNRYCPEYPAVNQRNRSGERVGSFFGAGGFTTGNWDYVQQLDLDGIRGRLLSSSYVPLEARSSKHPLSVELAALFERCQINGRLELRYRSSLYLGRLAYSTFRTSFIA